MVPIVIEIVGPINLPNNALKMRWRDRHQSRAGCRLNDNVVKCDPHGWCHKNICGFLFTLCKCGCVNGFLKTKTATPQSPHSRNARHSSCSCLSTINFMLERKRHHKENLCCSDCMLLYVWYNCDNGYLPFGTSYHIHNRKTHKRSSYQPRAHRAQTAQPIRFSIAHQTIRQTNIRSTQGIHKSQILSSPVHLAIGREKSFNADLPHMC